MSSYCVALKPTPMLNTPNFKEVFGQTDLPLDEKGLLRFIEMIALPGTKFQIKNVIDSSTLEVMTNDYPNATVYIDSRFVQMVPKTVQERIKTLPAFETIQDHLKNALGLPYIWGGNWGQGIPEILSLYEVPTSSHLSIRTLAGVDCSGLLYEATSGYTPRNTSQLLKFGREVPSIEAIQPLDFVIYPGHVILIFDQETTIESRYSKGVVLTDLKERLLELSSTPFSIRRFFFSNNKY